MRPLALFILSLFFLYSCNEESERYLSVAPTDLAFNVNSGDILKFNIAGYSVSGIVNFEIKFSPKNGLSSILLDSTLETAVPNLDLSWEYEVPTLPDELTEAELIMTITDNIGESVWNSRILFITSADYLVELAGFEIHSSLSENSSNHNAFSFYTNSTMHSSSNDSSILHIVDGTDSTFTNESLSLKWISPANCSFVRFNDFDYASAKYGNLINSFNSGVSTKFVSGIQAKDIILVRYDYLAEDEYAVVKVTSVIDEDGVENDRYIFNIKH